jgi:hypothetical protein
MQVFSCQVTLANPEFEPLETLFECLALPTLPL